MINLLAVDLGASNGRVILCRFDGAYLKLEEVHRFGNHPVSIFEKVYWNIHSLFNEVKIGIIKAAKLVGSIQSLGIDSWAVDYGFVDAKGSLLDAPRHYRDPRNLKAMRDVNHRIGEKELFLRTGIQILPINTLYQLYDRLHENPNLLSSASSILMIPDLLNFFLTGEKRAEFTNATTTQFLNPYSGNWDVALLNELNIPTHLLPPVVQPATVLGSLIDQDLSQIAGLTSLQVIHTTSHDTAAAVVSVPNNHSSFAYISSGTWSLLGTVVSAPVITEKAQLFNFTNEGGLGNYRLLKNIMGLWLLQETQRVLAASGDAVNLDELIRKAQLAPEFSCLIDPDDARFMLSGDMPLRIREICHETGQKPPDDSGALVRSVFESLALKYRLVLEQLEEVTGQRYEVIHIVGGGSQNQILSQFAANATNRMVVTGPVEASAVGNALVQLLALGEISGKEQMNEILRNSFQFTTYMPEQSERWEAAYERFCRIMQSQTER